MKQTFGTTAKFENTCLNGKSNITIYAIWSFVAEPFGAAIYFQPLSETRN